MLCLGATDFLQTTILIFKSSIIDMQIAFGLNGLVTKSHPPDEYMENALDFMTFTFQKPKKSYIDCQNRSIIGKTLSYINIITIGYLIVGELLSASSCVVKVFVHHCTLAISTNGRLKNFAHTVFLSKPQTISALRVTFQISSQVYVVNMEQV